MKLSIIVPVYNLENYIATTLESLLSIRFSSDYEIIVINDGSKDGSESVIRGYQRIHDQIVLYSIENQGVSNARNFGISKATGEYITFVDGDDTVEPEFFEKAVQELDKGGYDFVQGNIQIEGMNRSWFLQYVETDEVIADRSVMLEKFLGPQKLIHNNACGMVFRADVVRKIQFDKTLHIAEDQKFVCDVLMNTNRVKLLSALCYHYYQRAGSAIHNMSMNQKRDQLEVLDYCSTFVSDETLKANIELRKFHVLLDMYITLTKNREDNSGIYNEINKLNLDRFFPCLDIKMRIHAILLCKARKIYDFIIHSRF